MAENGGVVGILKFNETHVKFSLSANSSRIFMLMPCIVATSPASLYVTICQGGFCGKLKITSYFLKIKAQKTIQSKDAGYTYIKNRNWYGSISEAMIDVRKKFIIVNKAVGWFPHGCLCYDRFEWLQFPPLKFNTIIQHNTDSI